MNMVQLVATRGTCVRRKTGCILVDDKRHVLATGYNGKASGLRECIEFPCAGATAKPGMELDKCEAIHAEANALLQCSDVNNILTAYCTTSPCNICVGLLMNTSCTRIVFLDLYPHDECEIRWARTYYIGFNNVRRIRYWIKYEPDEHFKVFSELSV